MTNPVTNILQSCWTMDIKCWSIVKSIRKQVFLLFRDGGQQCSLSWCLCGCCQEDALWHIWRLPQRPQSNRSLSKSSGITIKSISLQLLHVHVRHIGTLPICHRPRLSRLIDPPGDSLQRSYQGVRPLPRAYQLCVHWECAICICPRRSLLVQARGTQVWPARANTCSHRYVDLLQIIFQRWKKWKSYNITVNRLCGSGFQSIVNGVQEILVGDAQVEDFQEHNMFEGQYWIQNSEQ